MANFGQYEFANFQRTEIRNVIWNTIKLVSVQKIYAGGYSGLQRALKVVSKEDYIACPVFHNQYGFYMSLSFKGHVKHQESLEVASRRELAEEAGFVPIMEPNFSSTIIEEVSRTAKEHLVVAYKITNLIPNEFQAHFETPDVKTRRVINLVYGTFEELQEHFSQPRMLLDNEDGCVGVIILSREQFEVIAKHLQENKTHQTELTFEF